jgi:hypothetical protein
MADSLHNAFIHSRSILFRDTRLRFTALFICRLRSHFVLSHLNLSLQPYFVQLPDESV